MRYYNRAQFLLRSGSGITKWVNYYWVEQYSMSLNQFHISLVFRKMRITLFWIRHPTTVSVRRWWVVRHMLAITPQLLFCLKNRNTRDRCELCSKLTIKTQERPHWGCSGGFIVNFEHIQHLFLVFLLLTLTKKMSTGILSTVKVVYSEPFTCVNCCLDLLILQDRNCKTDQFKWTKDCVGNKGSTKHLRLISKQ